MISVDEAIQRILTTISPLGLEKVSLLEAFHRVCGEEVKANRKFPPADFSMMDGYAVRYEDIKRASPDSPVRLREIGVLRPGLFPLRKVQRGETIRIMTGAPIPEGVDTILPLEETDKEGEFISVTKPVPAGRFIRKAGEEVKEGDQILSMGDLISSFQIERLALLGRSTVTVYQKPRIGILSIGDELVDVDGPLNEATIISSNLYAISAQVLECGGIPIRLGIVKDKKEVIQEKIIEGVRTDLLISSAGTSSGDYDFVKEVLVGLRAEMIFSEVAMRPGKSVAFWRWNGKPIFNLPGNPMASWVSFEELVRPALLKMMGHRQLFRPLVDATLEEDIRKDPGFRHLLFGLVSFKGGSFFVTPLTQKGYSMRNSIKSPNGLIIILENQEWLRAGEKVKVKLFDLNFFQGV